jgi:hypothetical protein
VEIFSIAIPIETVLVLSKASRYDGALRVSTGTTASCCDGSKWKIAKPSTVSVAASCAEPSKYETFAGPDASTISEAFPAIDWSSDASVNNPDDGCCGNVSGSTRAVPSSANKLTTVSAAAELLLTSVNVVFQPPSAAKCGIEPIKFKPATTETDVWAALAPSMAVNVALCLTVTVPVIAEKVALLWPACAVTLPGTETIPLLLPSGITVAPVAAWLSDSVHMLDELPPNVEGAQERDVCCAGAIKSSVLVSETPPPLAVRTAV